MNQCPTSAGTREGNGNHPTPAHRAAALGWWVASGLPATTEPHEVRAAVDDIGQPLFLVQTAAGPALARGGSGTWGPNSPAPDAVPLIGVIPACWPQQLGDATFCADHGLRYPYVAGAMANGIGSVEIVEAMSQAGMVGFFGAAGLPPARVEDAIDRIAHSLGQQPYGVNLIHSPNEPSIESAIVDIFLRRGVRLVEASAYLDLTLPLIRYRLHGIHRDATGRVITPNHVIAKVSRVEVARRFFAPPPERWVEQLVQEGQLSEEQAQLARRVPVAQDLTAEADSGGHTDNRPAIALIPTMLALRDRMQAEHGYEHPLRVGAAGGIATPASVAAAFALGAAYVVGGSIHQACIEAGTSDLVRTMLAQAEQADVIMAPAADMFEMGVKVQVLKRGTMFAMRAAKLYELYRNYASLDVLPVAERTQLEKNYFRAPLEEIWSQTRTFFQERDPSQITRAETDPKHRMALVFRWYLGQSSRWANRGEASRQMDFQVWCGPAMGAFNEWVRGSFLEQPGQRRIVTVALNLLYGAAVATRLHALRCQGLTLTGIEGRVAPLELVQLEERLSIPRSRA